VPVVAVDDDDLRRIAVGASQPVGHECAARTSAEDDDAGHGSTVTRAAPARIRA
jgi:hypothetical protein